MHAFWKKRFSLYCTPCCVPTSGPPASSENCNTNCILEQAHGIKCYSIFIPAFLFIFFSTGNSVSRCLYWFNTQPRFASLFLETNNLARKHQLKILANATQSHHITLPSRHWLYKNMYCNGCLFYPLQSVIFCC